MPTDDAGGRTPMVPGARTRRLTTVLVCCWLIVASTPLAGVQATTTESLDGMAASGVGAPDLPALLAPWVSEIVPGNRLRAVHDAPLDVHDDGALLDAARSVLDARRDKLVRSGVDDGPAAGIALQDAHLAMGRDLLSLLHADHADGVSKAIALAKAGTRHQSALQGVSWMPPPAVPQHAKPSEALFALLARHDRTPAADDAQRIRSLDTVQEPMHGALTRVVDAFIAFEEASALAFGDTDGQRLHDILDKKQAPTTRTQDALSSPAGTLRALGIDVAPVFSTRNALLDAVEHFHVSTQAGLGAEAGVFSSVGVFGPGGGGGDDGGGSSPPPECPSPIQVPPVFSITLAACDDVYEGDFIFVFDAGGNDVYHNNAGGGGWDDNLFGCLVNSAAALIDLGAGNDSYGDPSSPRPCAANGGARVGSGFLLDAGGDDVYVGGIEGINGGAQTGAGFLLDTDGSDTYMAEIRGTNGGGYQFGFGFLLDAGANWDLYSAGGEGTNGGANFESSGFLFDGGGNDAYFGTDNGVNGGADGSVPTSEPGVGNIALTFSSGFILDAGGDDVFQAGGVAANGGGVSVGVGSLLDLGAGIDEYSASSFATNGGGTAGGVGLLLDAGGDDDYTASNSGTNGGGDFDGVGALIDAAGSDSYRGGDDGVNGGGNSRGSGLLADLDINGHDSYTAGNDGTNGGGADLGQGLLFDAGGNDLYTAEARGVNGGGSSGSGLLFDGGGTDAYSSTTGSCSNPTDCTVVPDGSVGVLIDHDNSGENGPGWPDCLRPDGDDIEIGPVQVVDPLECVTTNLHWVWSAPFEPGDPLACLPPELPSGDDVITPLNCLEEWFGSRGPVIGGHEE